MKDNRPVFLAPMADITHSAFRRLVSEFGGYDALFTEMLHGNGLKSRNAAKSSYTKKRKEEGNVIYQLLLTGEEDIPEILEILEPVAPYGIDLNIGCSAPSVLRRGSGYGLFTDKKRLSLVLSSMRRSWTGPLSVKCRLGTDRKSWKGHFTEVLKIIEGEGVDFLTVHPRFADEKLKRPPVWDCIPWIKEETSMPIIINGDILGIETVKANPGTLGLADGFMLGRIAIAKPWIFREFTTGESVNPDYAGTWDRFCGYVIEDFQPDDVVNRIKIFTSFYARNFYDWHGFMKRILSVRDLETIRQRSMAFLKASPRLEDRISFSGI